MNRREAKRILMLYRPGLDDDHRQFAEALGFARADPELNAWLEQQGRSDAVLRRKLREIEAPHDLLEKIVRQRPVEFRRRNAVRWLQLAAAIVLLAGLAVFWWRPHPRNDLIAYEKYLTNLISRPYRMSLETDDLARIQKFLAANQAPADYTLSKSLAETRALGCATLSWNGNPVSMLCFADRATEQKIFLFVVKDRAIPDSPRDSTPRLRKKDDFTAATWGSEGKTYVLTMRGGPMQLQKYL